jgi:Ca2+-binding EF-hand superfamily protein
MTAGKISAALVAVLGLGLATYVAAADEQSPGPSPEQRQQMREHCKQNPEECRAKMKERAEQWFKKVDADGDGTISRQEAEANAPRLAKHFDEIDTDHDGTLTREELRAARKAMHERHHQGGRPGSQDDKAQQ